MVRARLCVVRTIPSHDPLSNSKIPVSLEVRFCMKSRFYVLSFYSILILFANCKIDQRVSADKSHRTVLASVDTNCQVVSVEPLYSFLFGLLPVFRQVEPEPGPGITRHRSYKLEGLCSNRVRRLGDHFGSPDENDRIL